MVDSLGGYSNSYNRSLSIRPMMSDSTQSSSNEPPASAGAINYLLYGEPDKRAPEQKAENKQGPIGGFLAGVSNGFTGMVKTLFSPQGLLMMAGGVALIAATGGAATPFLAAAGAGVGAFQMGQGLLKGDWEQVGRGAFGLGTTALGAKFDFKTVSNVKTGEKFALASGSTKFQDVSNKAYGIGDSFKLVAGKKMPGESGAPQSIYQVMKDNVGHRIAQASGWFGSKS